MMKYILFEDFSGKPVPIIFPERIEFAEFREQMPYATVIAAGRVSLRAGAFACDGESKTLEVASRPEDATIIAGFFAER
jgi:hypothetical protein